MRKFPVPNGIVIVLCILLQPTVRLYAQCWKLVLAGSDHSLALKADNTLWAWGGNNSGQLGDGSRTAKIRPVLIAPGSTWKAISTGDFFSVGIKTDGTLWTWGGNSFNQLGDGTNTPSYMPKQIGTSTDWQSVSAGRAHVVALKSNNTLWSWGYGRQGQTGTGLGKDTPAPVQIGNDEDWTYVAAGDIHSLALKSNGTLWAWGYNNYGELGDGTNLNRYSPAQIGIARDWLIVSAGAIGSLAIKSDGSLWSWGGYNQVMNFGDGTFVPTQIGTATDWQSISYKQDHSLATKKDGTLWSWNGYMLETDIGAGTLVPLRTGTGTNWESVSAGINFSLAIQTDSTLWAWGLNTSGQLGECGLTNEAEPVKIACNATCDPLPVTLVSFTVKRQGDDALLNWHTAAEINSKGFEIERNLTGTFYKIGSVYSHNSAGGSHYTFTDKEPGYGMNFYRLKISDVDGNYWYSNTFTILFNHDDRAISIYPNPVADNVISIDCNFQGKQLDIKIYDLGGKRLYQSVRPNNRHFNISIPCLNPGNYVLRISDGIKSTNKEIVKE